MPLNGLVVEDLSNGLNEWRNIQEVVRVTFKILDDTVKQHSNQIKQLLEHIARLEKQVEAKPSKTELQTSIASKASILIKWIYNERKRTKIKIKKERNNI